MLIGISSIANNTNGIERDFVGILNDMIQHVAH